ncbi:MULTISPECIES: hypothetical protein [Microbacterium]|uniref:Uncharacterized protein n=1 Tax=Microbacterium barkeri TaxID=33917 RepID=A0A9W6LWR9_9MICO|nr:hypothetical protein [Microbacterium barkeri]MDR6876453.1 flagellar biosynthesis/type III secretory pathway M-ring protein FliF/YscJ [Microbacterium barkeri]GLJ62079.1 hypothetical protein GCM10017576_22090 [Microbacterium barkeri]
MPALAVLAATPSPQPTVDPDLVTPGPLGFATIVVLVIAVFLLVFDMLRRVRRARYREEANAVLDAEEAAAQEAAAQEGADPRGTGTASDGRGETGEEPTPGR